MYQHTYSIKHASLVQDLLETHKAFSSQGIGNRGHGVEHDLKVASYASRIAPDDYTKELSWIAALLHSTDRFIPQEEVSNTVETKLVRFICLPARDLSLIHEAVLEHHKPNDPADNPVTVILKDADRMANLDIDVILRAAQLHSTAPVYLIHTIGRPHPESTIGKPKSVLDNLYYLLEWVYGDEWWEQTESLDNLCERNSWFRTGPAREHARMHGRKLLGYIREIEDSVQRSGLYNLPSYLHTDL